MATIEELVEKIRSLHPDGIILARPPFKRNSEARVLAPPELGPDDTIRPDPSGLTYFLGVSMAQQVVDGVREQRGAMDLRQMTEQLIYYAVNDAYKP